MNKFLCFDRTAVLAVVKGYLLLIFIISIPLIIQQILLQSPQSIVFSHENLPINNDLTSAYSIQTTAPIYEGHFGILLKRYSQYDEVYEISRDPKDKVRVDIEIIRNNQTIQRESEYFYLNRVAGEKTTGLNQSSKYGKKINRQYVLLSSLRINPEHFSNKCAYKVSLEYSNRHLRDSIESIEFYNYVGTKDIEPIVVCGIVIHRYIVLFLLVLSAPFSIVTIFLSVKTTLFFSLLLFLFLYFALK